MTSPALRHPLDPEPVRSTKAGTVFTLGLVALLTGPMVGGVVPASIALVLSAQARRQAYTSGGYLTGGAWLRRGERLAWAGIALAATTVVVALIIGVIDFAGSPTGRDFSPTVD
jgi:hydroxylaminobenzene mutase